MSIPTTFEEVCLIQGYDSEKTLFEIDFQDNLWRWEKGKLVSTGMKIRGWSPTTIDYRSRPILFTGKLILYGHNILYLRNGRSHRSDGPAYVGVRDISLKWFRNGEIHNTTGPSFWYQDSELKANRKQLEVTVDYYINGTHMFVEDFANYYLIANLKEYVAPTTESMLHLRNSEFVLITYQKKGIWTL